MDILFPTLVACSFDCETTRAILQTEMSLDLIENYIQVSSDFHKNSFDDIYLFFFLFD